MAFFVYFHFQKIFIYFFFRAISFLGRRIIKMYYPELFINPIFYLFIMFLGESLSVFLFIILKIKLIKSRKTKKFEVQYGSFLKRLLKIVENTNPISSYSYPTSKINSLDNQESSPQSVCSHLG